MAIIITLKSSVTRFGEMTPLWQIFKALWQIFKALWQNFQGLVSVEQNFEPHLANLFTMWQILIVLNGQKINK